VAVIRDPLEGETDGVLVKAMRKALSMTIAIVGVGESELSGISIVTRALIRQAIDRALNDAGYCPRSGWVHN